MFKKLRNRLVTIIVLLTSAILFFSFALVYISADLGLHGRDMPKEDPPFDIEISDTIDRHVKQDRNFTLSSLVVTLVVTGLAVEIIIIVAAYILAGYIIRPIEKAYERQKQFIANASHEIKTPLAAIQANLEAANIKSNHWLDNASLEVARLSALNGELLNLACADIVEGDIQKEKFKIYQFMRQQVENFTPQARKKKAKLTLHCQNKTEEVALNKVDFEKIVNILLDNAIKYCAHKVTLNVSAKSLVVSNDGAIIPKEKLEHIFERFYQVDKSNVVAASRLKIRT